MTRSRFTGAAALVAAVALPIWLSAQQPPARGAGGGRRGGNGNSLGRGAPPLTPDNQPFDKHDLSGVWLGNQYGFNAKYEPPLTPEGKKKFDAQKPSWGGPGGPAASRTPQVPSGRRRATPPAQGNDYVGACNPLGLVRLLTYDPAPMEIVMTPNRMLQMFEWTWDHREVWLDGRPLAKVEEYLPRWNGYSVGKWEGDTLVVTTVGLDDRQWLDAFGFPLSDQAVLEERYSRPSPNRLRLEMTLTDPANYTRPWKSTPKVWGKIPKEAMKIGGWA